MKGPSTLLEFETIFPNEESWWVPCRSVDAEHACIATDGMQV